MISVFTLIKTQLLEADTVKQPFCCSRKSIFEIEGELSGTGRIRKS